MICSALLATIVLAVFMQGGTTVSGQPVLPAEGPERRIDFNGTWRYNAELSVDAATRRPETDRRRSNPEALSASPPLAGAQQSNALGATSASVIQDGIDNLYIARRDARRDLLEIAPRLAIAASDDAVTITDDLDRVLTFHARGDKRTYQLGAASFQARSTWNNGRLHVDIEGPQGLRVRETWFVSDDGSRLFLVIRIGDSDGHARPVGVNRVYDRVR